MLTPRRRREPSVEERFEPLRHDPIYPPELQEQLNLLLYNIRGDMDELRPGVAELETALNAGAGRPASRVNRAMATGELPSEAELVEQLLKLVTELAVVMRTHQAKSVPRRDWLYYIASSVDADPRDGHLSDELECHSSAKETLHVESIAVAREPSRSRDGTAPVVTR